MSHDVIKKGVYDSLLLSIDESFGGSGNDSSSNMTQIIR
jgi:hypothetical protein